MQAQPLRKTKRTMTSYQIRHKKTGHTQIVTEAQLNLLKQKGWSRQFEVEAIKESKTNFYPPEILKTRPESEYGRKNQKSTKRISE